MSGFDLDLSDLTDFGDHLVASVDDLLDAVKPVVAKGALNVKTSMREQMEQSEHFAQVAPSITYDTREGATWVEAEIGPKTAGQVVGDLAHLAYFGGAHGGGGTVRDPQVDLDEEEPKFAAGLSAALGKAFR